MNKVTKILIVIGLTLATVICAYGNPGLKVRCIIKGQERVIDGIVVKNVSDRNYLIYSDKNNYYIIPKDFCRKLD